MSERFLIRTHGGPHEDTFVDETGSLGWPLPDELPDDGGVYVKVSESQLGPVPDGVRVVRGAEYEWRPAGGDA